MKNRRRRHAKAVRRAGGVRLSENYWESFRCATNPWWRAQPQGPTSYGLDEAMKAAWFACAKGEVRL